jgi:thiamine biosynthesis lipoprotein
MTEAITDPPRVVHVEHCMGTVFTIDIRDPGAWGNAVGAVDAVVVWLHRVDAVFSTYRRDSDISRLGRGELSLADCDADVADVLELCAQMQHESGGYFTTRWQGQLDPTGLVKGWAIERASRLLQAHGSHNHAVNGGGDMQLAGEAAPGRPWRVGISDPLDYTRVLTVVAGRDMAVATSGTAERGAHIINPFTGTPPDGLASVTVVGPALTRVDSYATAAFAMGQAALAWVDTLPGHEALLVRGDGTTLSTPGFGRLTEPPQ